MADAQSIEEAVANRIIEAFKTRIVEASDSGNEELAKAFGAVASDYSRPRGRKVFEFLQQTLIDNGSHSLQQRQGAANALSFTNLSSAVEVLAEHYPGLSRVPLVRMGNLAIPALLQKSSEEALEDLFRIGTPEAARALVPLLWDADSARATWAAWFLGQLLPRGYVKESLQDCRLKEEWLGAEALDWVWVPFSEDGEAMAGIANRIAYLLSTGLPERVFRLSLTNIPSFDPRLVIPLCAIVLRDRAPNLPETIDPDISALRERTEKTLKVQHSRQTAINGLLNGDAIPQEQLNHKRSDWEMLLRKVQPELQLELLARLIENPTRPPEKEDWRNFNRRSNYSFKTGWHYYLTLGISFVVSLAVLVWMFVLVVRKPESWLVGPTGLVWLIEITFWVALREGIEARFEPELFQQLGWQGLRTFAFEFRLLLREGLVAWAGVKLLANSLRGQAVAGALAGAGAVMAGFGIGIWGRAEEESRWRWAAVFAFPFFCWFPLTFTLFALMFWSLSGPIGLCVPVGILAFCAGLWVWGKKLDRAARNPLTGILDRYEPTQF